MPQATSHDGARDACRSRVQRFGTRSRPASRASKWWVCWHRLVLALHTALRQRQYRQQQLRRSASSPPADQSRMPPGADCTMALELTPWASGWSASRAVRPRMSGTHAFAILLPHQCRHNKAERAWILHLLDCHTIIRCAPRCALKTLLQRFGSVQVGWVCVAFCKFSSTAQFLLACVRAVGW